MKRKVKIKTGALLLNYSATMRGFEKDGELKLLMDDEEAMERRRGCWKDGWFPAQQCRNPRDTLDRCHLPTTNADSM